MNRALLAGGVIAAACLTAAAPALAQTSAQTPAPKPAPTQTPKPADATVSSVNVNGARQEVETAIDRRSYSVANDLQAKTGNIADVLRNVPSVQVDVNGNLTLRGDGGVTVLVDGKPSVLFSRDTLAAALQSTPADQVERIEVITNPSAEFKADGSAGIINLVMKKAKGGGRTGSIRAGVTSTGSGSATLAHGFNSDKLSVVDSLSLRHDRRKQSTDYERRDASGADQDALRGVNQQDGANGRVSLDYDVSPKTRLTATLSGAWQEGEQDYTDQFIHLNSAGATTSARTRDTDMSQGAHQVQLDLGMRRKTDKDEVSVRANYGQASNYNNRLDLTTLTAPAPGTLAQTTYRTIDTSRASLSADYQNKLEGGSQLKAGYLLEYNDGTLNQTGQAGTSIAALGPDPSQSLFYEIDETHHQAYVTLQRKFGQVTALGGLRGEAVDLDMRLPALASRTGQNYTRLYPTLHLSWPLGDGRNLTASYSKRVSRPSPPDLLPFRLQQGPNSFSEGNPNLQPQETHSFEFGYEKRKGAASLLATAYYRQTDNAFSVVITDLGNGSFLQTRANLGHQTNAGLELVLGNKLTPKLTYNLSANGYWTEIEAPGLGYASRSSFATYGRANLNWQVTPKDFVQINVFANGKSLLPQGYGKPTWSGNIGYRRTVNDKVSVMLTVQDPFRTLKNELVLDTATVKDRRISRGDGRVASLTLVWNFAGKPRSDTSFDFAPGGSAGSPVP